MERHFLVSLDTCSSRSHEFGRAMPQGLLLGTLTFNVYILLLGKVIRKHRAVEDTHVGDDLALLPAEAQFMSADFAAFTVQRGIKLCLLPPSGQQQCGEVQQDPERMVSEHTCLILSHFHQNCRALCFTMDLQHDCSFPWIACPLGRASTAMSLPAEEVELQ